MYFYQSTWKLFDVANKFEWINYRTVGVWYWGNKQNLNDFLTIAWDECVECVNLGDQIFIERCKQYRITWNVPRCRRCNCIWNNSHSRNWWQRQSKRYFNVLFNIIENHLYQIHTEFDVINRCRRSKWFVHYKKRIEYQWRHKEIHMPKSKLFGLFIGQNKWDAARIDALHEKWTKCKRIIEKPLWIY